MKKQVIISILCLLLISLYSHAQEKINVHHNGEVIMQKNIEEVSDISFVNGVSIFHSSENTSSEIPFSQIDSITFSSGSVVDEKEIQIIYQGNSVTIVNPYESEGLVITSNNAHVSVNSASTSREIVYSLSGNTADGSFQVSNSPDFTLVMNNLDMTSTSTPAIYITAAADVLIRAEGENRLSDHSSNNKNACLSVKGNITFEGAGNIEVNANKRNGISSDKGIVLNGGKIKINSLIEDAKAMKADESIAIRGGSLDVSVAGDQAKGIKTGKDFELSGGVVSVTASGKTVLTAAGSGYSTSYCSALKSDGDVLIKNGILNIDLPETNNGGKGISADGNITISGGAIQISTSGNGATYVDESGVKDSYSSSCIKSDGDILIAGGAIICNSSGTGGKGIAADGTLIIGNQEDESSAPVIEVTTSGERFFVSSSGRDEDYCNPKAIKSQGNLTVYNGNIRAICKQTNEGGEGLESKATLTIHGGLVYIEAYDDCINASSHLEITGGTVYCSSSGNDAIDSNGTLSISGGTVIAHGTRAPEGGFDCDNSRFAITGGVIIGTGGSTSTPTTSACTQYSIKYNNATPGNAICLKDASGEIVLMFQLPVYSGNSGGGPGGGPGGGGNSMLVLLSHPKLKTGSYTLHYGGTISSEEDTYGYSEAGSYTGGSTKNLTINSLVTNVQ